MSNPASPALLWLATQFVSASVASAAMADGPRIEFQETNHDFGRVMTGRKLGHSFVFTNSGAQPLEILAVRSTCGCTTEAGWDRRVAPARTGRIPVRLDTGRMEGPINKTVTVVCNDPHQSNIVLGLKALIWKPIDVSPALASFTIVEATQSALVRAIRITNNLAEPLGLMEPACTSTNFRAKLKTVVPNRVFELEVAAIPPMPGPYVYGVTSLKTTTTNLPLISIPTVATVLPAIQIIPTRIVLTENPVAFERMWMLRVRIHGDRDVTVLRGSVNAPGIVPQIRAIQPGRFYTVALSLPKGFKIGDGENVELTLDTSHPRFARLSVPIGVLRPPIAETNQSLSRR